MLHNRLANMLINPVITLLFLLSPVLLMNPQDQRGRRGRGVDRRGSSDRQAGSRDIQRKVKDLWVRIAAMEKAWLQNERKHSSQLVESLNEMKVEGQKCTDHEKSLRAQKAEAETQYKNAVNHQEKPSLRTAIKELREQLAKLVNECEKFFQKQKQWMEHQNSRLESMVKEIQQLEAQLQSLRDEYNTLTGKTMPAYGTAKGSSKQRFQRTRKLSVKAVERRDQRQEYQPRNIEQRQGESTALRTRPNRRDP